MIVWAAPLILAMLAVPRSATIKRIIGIMSIGMLLFLKSVAAILVHVLTYVIFKRNPDIQCFIDKHDSNGGNPLIVSTKTEEKQNWDQSRAANFVVNVYQNYPGCDSNGGCGPTFIGS